MTKKNSLISCITICFIMIFCYSATADSIKGSKHDFSMNGGSNFSKNYRSGGVDITEVCVFCHTPHGASTASAYKTEGGSGTPQVLWNRVLPVAAGATNDITNYKLYSSPTLTKITPAAPTGTSLMCLSCHDGVTSIAVGTLLNPPGAGSDVTLRDDSLYDKIGQLGYDPFLVGALNTGDIYTVPWNVIDKIDLSNDHPVSFPWKNDFPEVKPVPSDTRLKLFGSGLGRMECSTCHDVHNKQYPPFLRMPNTNSDMCLACHIK